MSSRRLPLEAEHSNKITLWWRLDDRFLSDDEGVHLRQRFSVYRQVVREYQDVLQGSTRYVKSDRKSNTKSSEQDRSKQGYQQQQEQKSTASGESSASSNSRSAADSSANTDADSSSSSKMNRSGFNKSDSSNDASSTHVAGSVNSSTSASASFVGFGGGGVSTSFGASAEYDSSSMHGESHSHAENKEDATTRANSKSSSNQSATSNARQNARSNETNQQLATAGSSSTGDAQTYRDASGIASAFDVNEEVSQQFVKQVTGRCKPQWTEFAIHSRDYGSFSCFSAQKECFVRILVVDHETGVEKIIFGENVSDGVVFEFCWVLNNEFPFEIHVQTSESVVYNKSFIQRLISDAIGGGDIISRLDDLFIYFEGKRERIEQYLSRQVLSSRLPITSNHFETFWMDVISSELTKRVENRRTIKVLVTGNKEDARSALANSLVHLVLNGSAFEIFEEQKQFSTLYPGAPRVWRASNHLYLLNIVDIPKEVLSQINGNNEFDFGIITVEEDSDADELNFILDGLTRNFPYLIPNFCMVIITDVHPDDPNREVLLNMIRQSRYPEMIAHLVDVEYLTYGKGSYQGISGRKKLVEKFQESSLYMKKILSQIDQMSREKKKYYQDDDIELKMAVQNTESATDVVEVTPPVNFVERLAECGLQEFTPFFRKNGWDDVDTWQYLTESELRSFGFGNGHLRKWRKLVNESTKNKMSDESKEKLQRYGLERFALILEANGYGNFEDWGSANHATLEKLGIVRGYRSAWDRCIGLDGERKRIGELEKEAQELKTRIDWMEQSHRMEVEGYRVRIERLTAAFGGAKE